METNPKKNFVCKFCNKRFSCGKSLGGHIRIHLSGGSSATAAAAAAAATDHHHAQKQEEPKLNSSNNLSVSANNTNGGGGGAGIHIHDRKDAVFEAGGGQSGGYVLRENPKKTTRFVADSSHTNLLLEKLCKECGKGFQSLKALCGHMACHSKNNFEDHSGTSEKLKELILDSQSDTETSAPSKRRRSKRMVRYKTVGVYSSSMSLAANGSFSSASDIEHEQEEVAMSLMMLSRDSGFKGCFSSFGDSSDNNSVVLEAKSSSTKLRIMVNNGVNCVYNGNEFVQQMKKVKQREGMSTENDDYGDSDSGYFRGVPKSVESDVSDHGFTGNDEFKKHKVEFGPTGFDDEEFDGESGKRLSRFRRVKQGLGKGLIEEDRYNQADRDSMKYDSRKRSKMESYNPEFAQKRANCSSLGGHETNQKKSNGQSDSIYESGENSIDTDYVPSPVPTSTAKMIQSSSRGKTPIQQNAADKKVGLKKGKVHECPFCSKVFRSGQALGGHKRSHFVGGGDDRTLVIKQEAPAMSMPRLIDLNLPVTMEEEANGFLPW